MASIRNGSGSSQGCSARRPRRVFLGCRSDFAHGLESHLRDAGIVDRRAYTLKPLKLRDIVEILTVANDRDLLKHYQLSIRYSDEECVAFAQRLLEAREGWQAPLLQLRLHRMWEDATSSGRRVFDAGGYRAAERNVASR